MDFRTCPACKASVLEDDVTECPFCGASMNGKPSAKAPAKAPAAAASKPAAAAGAAKPAAPAETKPAAGAKPPAGGPRPPVGAGGRPGIGRGNTVADEENPFDMDMSELQKAVPVAPKPTKQRTLEVKCEMCEAVGYVAPQHQGKLVKCANPNCKHPYFTVPIPKKESADSGLRKKKGLSIVQVLALVIAGIGLAGTAIWWFLIRVPPTAPDTGPTLLPPAPYVEEKKEPQKGPAPVQRISLDEIRQGAITELTRISATNDANQALAVRYLAESYASAGQIPQAIAELQRLAQKTPDSPYLQIEPLVRLYLQARKAGAPDAGKYLDAALKAAENLPQTGRRPLDAANALSAALVLADRMADTQKLIQPQAASESRADYSMLWTAAVYGNAFDFQVLSEIPAFLAAPNPQNAAVTWILSAWGEPDKALAWAKSAGSVEAVDASLAVWAAHLGQSVKSTSEGVLKLDEAIKNASPAGQIRALSNYAYQRAVAGDVQGAQGLMAKADAALKSLPPKPTPAAMPTIKEIYESSAITNAKLKARVGLPDAGPQRSAALAYANLAVLHLKLGDKAAVESLLDNGLDYAEAIAPPAPLVQTLLQRENSAHEADLDQALGLKGVKQKSFAALNKFRPQLKSLGEEAAKREQFERELIRDIAYRGEPGLAWTIVQKRDALPSDRSPMLSATPLAYYIMTTAVAVGDNATANNIGKTKSQDQIDFAINALVYNMKEAKFAPALEELKKIYRAGTYDRDRVDIAVLRRVSQYQTRTKSPEKVFDLIRQLPDPQVQEAAMYLMAARAVVEDKGPELYKLTSPDRKQREMSYTERTALARGYVAGVEAAPKSQPAVKPPTAAKELTK